MIKETFPKIKATVNKPAKMLCGTAVAGKCAGEEFVLICKDEKRLQRLWKVFMGAELSNNGNRQVRVVAAEKVQEVAP